MNTVIYYPYFYPDPQWLKVAGLCWDRVYTLTSGHAPQCPEDVAALNEAFQHILAPIDIRSVSHDPAVLATFEGWVATNASRLKLQELSWKSELILLDFFDPLQGGPDAFLQTLSRHHLNVRKTRSGPVQIPRWDWEGRLLTPEAIAPPIPFEVKQAEERYHLALLEGRHDDALDIVNQNLVAKGKERLTQDLVPLKPDQQLLYLPQGVALHYLSLCADNVAREGSRDLVTSRDEYTETVLHGSASVTGTVTQAVLEAYLPSDFSSLPIEQIAELRTQLQEKRLQFQVEVQNHCRELLRVASEGEARLLEKRIIDLAKDRVATTRKVYERARLDAVLKTFSVSLAPPALVSSLASALGIGLFAPAGIATALSLFVASRLFEFDKAAMDRKNSAWSYVLDVNESGERWWKKLWRGVTGR
jgi:hypothetical protein